MRHGLVFNLNRIIVVSLSSLLMVSSFVQAQLDDPTRPANIVAGSVLLTDEVAASWDLSSILISPQRRVAIINGNTVQAGEILAGAKVLRINETNVKLKYRGEVIVLKLFPRSIKAVHDALK